MTEIWVASVARVTVRALNMRRRGGLGKFGIRDDLEINYPDFYLGVVQMMKGF
jgi:hypothetical protein